MGRGHSCVDRAGLNGAAGVEVAGARIETGEMSGTGAKVSGMRTVGP